MKPWLHSGTETPHLAVYRCEFELPGGGDADWEFTGDELFTLSLDGKLIAAGPEADRPGRWHYGEWRGRLAPGPHRLEAVTAAFPDALRPCSRHSVHPGWYFRDRKGSVDAAWTVEVLHPEFTAAFPDWGAPPRVRLRTGRRELRPAGLRRDERLLEAPETPQHVGAPLDRYRREDHGDGRTILHFGRYVCAYAAYRFRGPGRATVRWTETTYRNARFDPVHLKGDKGNRDGSAWVGNADEIEFGPGEFTWRDLSWRAGTRVEIVCSQGAEFAGADFFRAGYPYAVRCRWSTPYRPLAELLPVALRTLRRCSHDTYMDCPYYERMMYVADAAIEALAGYVVTCDTAPAEKALTLFAASRDASGMIRSRFPSNLPQTIPSFALIYILMLHDFASWRDRPETVRRLLPAARGIADCFERSRGRDGLVRPDGWHFIDWVDRWAEGVPPGTGKDGTNAALNAFHALALGRLAELETAFGAPGNAVLYRERAEMTRRGLFAGYFDAATGLLADDLDKTSFSEHPQIIAALAFDAPELVEALLQTPGLNRAGIYFSHYYFEMCRRYRLSEAFYRRLAQWYGLGDAGLTTVPEEFERPRSDCHAWSAHPLFHYFATMLGIRPVGFGGRQFAVEPLPGPYRQLHGAIPTPHGEISVTIADGTVTVGGGHPRIHRPASSMVQAM